MARPRFKVDENYICLSDIMLGLMVIFLFISICFIMESYDNNFRREDIYNTINKEMIKVLQKDNIKLGKDLSLKFINNNNNLSDELFPQSKSDMTTTFKNKLDRMWPQYQRIITSKKFSPYISEIRIEGHTDNQPPKGNLLGSYEYNLELSSKRAQEVLKYIRKMPCYRMLPDSTKVKLQFLLTANGMSYSRALNDKSEIAFTSKNKLINNNLSRRVEFKLVTTNPKLAENL